MLRFDVWVQAIGFLHTSEVHRPTFRSLVADRDPLLQVVDAVDQALLDDARARGVDEDVRQRLEARLAELSDHGAGVIVCTCTTLGDAAEQLAETVGLPVLRVDRPMMELAAEIGGRIAVVMAIESTVAPTLELLRQHLEASDASGAVVIEARCFEAWRAFEAGDVRGYADQVAQCCREVADQADVILLGQASMAAAAAELTDLSVPVLCTPSTAVDRAIATVQARRQKA